MATNGVNSAEDAEMAECDGEKVVTMMDVLQEQQDFEDDANAVLGASDEKNCTYAKGYIKRQAIYACLTCCPEAKDDPTKRAGVCLACSLNCHENHDLIELYTKRNFRCDCGNPKFSSNPCQFTPNKTDLNTDNSYNQNFSGIYCNCHRPYPDPEAAFEDEMIQCIICEDWLHTSHLDAAVPSSDQYSEMICKTCMGNNEFLHDYSEFAVVVETGDLDIVTINGATSLLSNGDLDKDSLTIGMENESANGMDAGATEAKTEITSMSEEIAGEELEKAIVTRNTELNDVPMDAGETEKVTDASTSVIAETTAETKADVETSEDSKNMEDVESAISEKPELNEVTETKDQSEEINDSEDNKAHAVPENLGNVADITAENKETASASEATSENEAKIQDDSAKTEKGNETSPGPGPVPDTKPEDSNETNDNTKAIGDTNDPKTTSTDIDVNDTKDDCTKEHPNETGNDSTNQTDNTNYISDSVSQIETIEAQNNDKNEVLKETETPSSECKENKRKLSTEEDLGNISTKKAKLDEKGGCTRPKGVKRTFKGSTFWTSNFRQKLCTCNECLSMYKDLSVLFLIDPEDTVTAYEALGKERINGATTQYEKGLEALSSLDRIQQINALTEYNNMRDKLLDFLKSFKDRKEIVKEEDIKNFFAGIKPKREPDGVYFCR